MLDFARHVDHVEATIASPSAAARCPIAASWRRSKTLHRLDPAAQSGPQNLTGDRLSAVMVAAAPLLVQAEPELDRLSKLLVRPGGGLFVSNQNGIILTYRTTAPDESSVVEAGMEIGADWSEAAEGTNGIGTCLVDAKPVTIDREQHFSARKRTITTIGVPLYGADGMIVGVIAYASVRPAGHEHSFPLITATLQQASKQIEAGIFYRTFAAHRIIVAPQEVLDTTALLAVDEDDLIVGATRAARQSLGLDIGRAITPRPARDLLSGGCTARDMNDIQRAAIRRALHRASGNVSAAARQLGIGRATLYNQMKRLDIRP